MKKIIFGTVVLALGIGLSGCGSDTPEEVAKIFASSLSDADMEEANSVASERVQKTLISLGSNCNQPAITKLADETIVVLNTIENKSNNSKYSEQLKKISESHKEEAIKFEENMGKELKTKYGAIKNAPKELRDKALKQLVEITNPMIEEEFKLFDIRTDNPDEVKKIIAEFIIRGGMGTRVNRGNLHILKNIVTNHLSQSKESITPECVAKYTEFGFIDDINIIETKDKSADSAVVRLKLINKEGKSEKVSVYVEKIKDEWKVASLSLNAW